MSTVRELLAAGADLPGDSPRRDTEVLLGHCLGKTRSWLYAWPEQEIETDQAQAFQTLLASRRSGTPIAYLTGEREFWSLTLRVDSDTLIPRPETETLVSWALELGGTSAANVLDLGTGSGAIALALASERRNWSLVALDQSAAALAVAHDNAQRHDLHSVRFLQSDWFDALGDDHPQHFDLIVANPPYIDAEDPHLQQGDVRFEPRSALVAAGAGLSDLQRIVADAVDYLQPDGWLLTEHGFQQGPAVRELLAAAGYTEIATRCDLQGIERVTGGQRRAQ